MLTRDGGLEELGAAQSMLDHLRLYGGTLPPLPGTRREAQAVAKLLPDAKLLVGTDATASNLRDAVLGAEHSPRFLHFATHGLTGSAERPNDASLALTQPASASPDDTGFLTFDELLAHWGGRLKGTELVVLSACDTGRGVRKGDTLMGLPLAFFQAGTPTFIASLWKVDDTATALLMHRLYQNLLGAFDEPRSIDGATHERGHALPKLAALREAQAWLRGLTLEQDNAARAALGLPTRLVDLAQIDDDRGGDDLVRRSAPPKPAAATDRPYEHPTFWSAFVMIGSPE